MPDTIRNLAAEILRLRELDRPKIVVNPLAEKSLDVAYAIQLELTDLRLNRGDIQIGYKVGCASRSIQAQMGIHEPIFGRLFAQDKRMSPQSIDRDEFDGLAIEGELAVELDCDPRVLPTALVDVEKAISRAFPVIELHNFGNEAIDLNAQVLVANNAIHAGFVQPRNDRANSLTKLENLSIRFDNAEVALVPFEELKATLLNSLLWLREKLLADEETPYLRPPVVVLCGSVAPLFRIADPTVIDVTYGDHDHIRCNVE